MSPEEFRAQGPAVPNAANPNDQQQDGPLEVEPFGEQNHESDIEDEIRVRNDSEPRGSPPEVDFENETEEEDENSGEDEEVSDEDEEVNEVGEGDGEENAGRIRPRFSVRFRHICENEWILEFKSRHGNPKIHTTNKVSFCVSGLRESQPNPDCHWQGSMIIQPWAP